MPLGLGEYKSRKIYVGLSGGVDSAVSAALLQKAGARVTGVFIKGWYPPGMPCTWAEDRRDAMRVAAHLKIPFRTLDASKEYKQSVIDYLLAEYKVGRTPNPDVMCNRDIKFGVFYRYAKKEGADKIATGHYRSGEKDQSYFLWAVPKEILANTVFPVGQMDKKEVRRLAKRLGLPVAEKKDSQGVCFLGSVSVKEFLAKELETSDPSILHTIGERIEGQYVVGKKNGKLILSNNITSKKMRSKDVHFTNENWTTSPKGPLNAQIRYRGPFLRGKVHQGRFVATRPPTEPVTPGQSIVFYRGTGLMGGGIIAG